MSHNFERESVTEERAEVKQLASSNQKEVLAMNPKKNMLRIISNLSVFLKPELMNKVASYASGRNILKEISSQGLMKYEIEQIVGLCGHISLVKWVEVHNIEFKCTNNLFGYAAKGGHLELIEWLHPHSAVATKAMDYAAQNG
eukprot:CAMPEP_0117776794 /NCGR_PEP_ID=MMETSP0947-20121206/27954_1 /TAXON_ID=44440 /ORGANISM="Chattonella subsalsa, Strain CCMP2191" /LENGTH=142 /DNA_ID=CAMNT_0005603777 /DNA_START=216 /DNA_END=641 /DNA_ORIENTATION=-